MNPIRRFCRWITGAEAQERWLRELQEKFPDRCPLCAYRRFGLQEFGKDTKLPPHQCVENPRSVWERIVDDEDVV